MPITSFDHRHFYINDEQFYPIISSKFIDENANTIIIDVDCSNQSNLNFEKQLNIAKKIQEENRYIIWNLQIGLNQPIYQIHNELYLQSCLHSVDYFVDNLFKPYQEISIGVILFSGEIPKFNIQDIFFKDWLSSLDLSQQSFNKTYLLKLFNCEILADYLRLIAPSIPDELTMIIRFDVSKVDSPSELMHLISKRFFEYFLLALKESKYPISAIKWEKGKGSIGQIDSELQKLENTPNVGVCFINHQMASPQRFQQFDDIFEKLSSQNISYRILEEDYATEQWDEIDYIIVSTESLTAVGKRMLQGFIAASGQVVYYDKPAEVSNEISFSRFLDKFK